MCLQIFVKHLHVCQIFLLFFKCLSFLNISFKLEYTSLLYMYNKYRYVISYKKNFNLRI